MFIVIVSVGLLGIVSAMSLSGRHGGDPAAHRQALALAESLLDEVELQPFTRCDPKGPPAIPGGACVIAEGPGPEPGETRTSTTTPFDNVNDYSGFTMPPVQAPDGTAISSLAGYSASVTANSGATLGSLPTADVILVQVTVTAPDGWTVSLAGYRTRQPQ